MKLWKKGLSLMLGAALIATAFTGTTFAASSRTKITRVNLVVDSDIAVGDDNGSVDVTTPDSHYKVSDVEIDNDDAEWTSGDKPKIEVTLEADSDYYFDAMSKSKVSLSGDKATYTGSRREDSSTTLIIKLTLKELEGPLEIDDLSWEDEETPTAKWEEVDGAKSYQVRLYRDSKSVGETATTTKNYYDFASRITKEGEYYFKVRVINNNSKKGEWYESDYIYVDDALLDSLKKTNGSNNNNGSSVTPGSNTTSQDQWIWDSNQKNWWYRYANGSYPTNGWLQIGGKWYCFDSVGWMRTGWIQAGNNWYYCGTDGAMLTNTTTPDGYRVDANGIWVH